MLLQNGLLERKGDSHSLTVKDKKNDTANNYSLDVDTVGDGQFNFFFKVENMKLLDGTYDVEISSKNISHYKNKSSELNIGLHLSLNQLTQFKLKGLYYGNFFVGREISTNQD